LLFFKFTFRAPERKIKKTTAAEMEGRFLTTTTYKHSEVCERTKKTTFLYSDTSLTFFFFFAHKISILVFV